MKRAKSIVALAVASSVTLSLAMPVFGSVFANRTPRVVPVEEVEVVVVPPTTQERLTALWSYPNLTPGSRPFLDHNSNVRGRLPVLSPAPVGSGYETINNKFFTNMFRHHLHSADLIFGDSSVSIFAGGGANFANDFDGFTADFTVDNQGRYAVITQTGQFGNAWDRITQKRPQAEFVTIVNKATRTEATRAQMDAYLAEVEALRTLVAEEAAATAEPTDEPDPFDDLELEDSEYVTEESPEIGDIDLDDLDQQFYASVSGVASAMDFGLEVVYDEEDNTVTLMLGDDFVASFVVGSDIVVAATEEGLQTYTLNAEFILYEDGEIYAPIEFFMMVLGLSPVDVDPEEEEDSDEEDTDEE
jgi:hypothetical protein